MYPVDLDCRFWIAVYSYLSQMDLRSSSEPDFAEDLLENQIHHAQGLALHFLEG